MKSKAERIAKIEAEFKKSIGIISNEHSSILLSLTRLSDEAVAMATYWKNSRISEIEAEVGE